MSTHVSSDIWKNSKATGTKLLILVSLADQANDEGWCWPSLDLIATRCRISRRTAQRHLAELEESGEVIRDERRGSSTRYKVIVSPVTVTGTRDNLAPVTLTGTRDELSPVSSEVVTRDSNCHGGGDIAMSPRIIIESKEPSLAKKEPKPTAVPQGWSPNLKARTYASENGIDVAHEASQFLNHHGSKGSKFVNWDLAFRTWLGNAKKWGRTAPVPRSDNPVDSMTGSWFPGA